VTDPAAQRRMFDHHVEVFGALDVAVLNAGVLESGAALSLSRRHIMSTERRTQGRLGFCLHPFEQSLKTDMAVLHMAIL
jgi:NAD(P)-dependent dehydrogenase (short-subunit alcohol dehydrogenase family)